MINPEYWVLYQILGKPYSAGPYSSLEEAEQQRQDVAGYEGVTNARVDIRYPEAAEPPR